MHSPIEQFVVKTIFEIQDPFFGYDISFTNASLFMVLASIVPLTLLIIGVRSAEMIPGKIQSISEMTNVDVVTGPYEIIAIAEADDLPTLGNLVSDGMHNVTGIVKTVSCLAVDP